MNNRMLLVASLSTFLGLGCAPGRYELHAITPLQISKKDPTLKILKEKVCKQVIVEQANKGPGPAGEQPTEASTGPAGEKARKVITRCETTPESDYGSWYIRRVYAKRQGKRLISTVEILWCDTGRHNYEKCRVAVAWSRNPTGGLGEEKGNDISQHVVPEAESFRKVKWPDQHGVPGHRKKRTAPGAKKKPDKNLEQRRRLQETPVADDL